MLDLHKNQLVALLDQECTSFVKVLLFSLHSRAYCEFPAHAPLAVTYMGVLDALALVDPTTSEPIHDETLAYVCGCAALVFREVRQAVVEACVWFDTLSSKDKTSVRKASDSNLCAWFWTDEVNLVARVRVRHFRLLCERHVWLRRVLFQRGQVGEEQDADAVGRLQGLQLPAY